jgi:hypothetical protein
MKNNTFIAISILLSTPVFANPSSCPDLNGQFQVGGRQFLVAGAPEDSGGFRYLFKEISETQNADPRSFMIPALPAPASPRCARINLSTGMADPAGPKTLIIPVPGTQVLEFYSQTESHGYLYFLWNIASGEILAKERFLPVTPVPTLVVTPPAAAAPASIQFAENSPHAETDNTDSESEHGPSQDSEMKDPVSSSSTQKRRKRERGHKPFTRKKSIKEQREALTYDLTELPKTQIKNCDYLSDLPDSPSQHKMIKGLFAAEFIPAGTVIGWYEGKVYSDDKEVKRTLRGKDTCREPDYAYFMDAEVRKEADFFSVNGAETEDNQAKAPVMSVNHSHFPNAKFETVLVKNPDNSKGYTFYKNRAIVLKASQDIPKGKEVLANYGKEYEEILVAAFGIKALNIQRANSNVIITEKVYRDLKKNADKLQTTGNREQAHLGKRIEFHGDDTSHFYFKSAKRAYEEAIELYLDAMHFTITLDKETQKAEQSRINAALSACYWGLGGVYNILTLSYPSEKSQDLELTYLIKVIANFKKSFEYSTAAGDLKGAEEVDTRIKEVMRQKEKLEKAGAVVKKDVK